MSSGTITFGPLSARDHRCWRMRRIQDTVDEVQAELAAGLPALPPGLLDANKGASVPPRSPEEERKLKRQTARLLNEHLQTYERLAKARKKRLEGYWERKRAAEAQRAKALAAVTSPAPGLLPT